MVGDVAQAADSRRVGKEAAVDILLGDGVFHISPGLALPIISNAVLAPCKPLMLAACSGPTCPSFYY